MGGSGALFGMLGVLVVELLQGWKWVKKPCVELFKLIIMIIIALRKLTTTPPLFFSLTSIDFKLVLNHTSHLLALYSVY